MKCLEDAITAKYSEILKLFSDEVERVRKVRRKVAPSPLPHSQLSLPQAYYNEKEDPPLTINMPPLSGKVAWARQLGHHLEQPIARLQARPALLDSGPGRAMVRRYNKIALALTEYEIVHYKAWVEMVDKAQQFLHVRRHVHEGGLAPVI